LQLEVKQEGNRYSQWGEESVVRAALVAIDELKPGGVLVEFGGSTGSENSNLFAFGEEGRSLVLIESNPKLFESLRQAVSQLPNIRPILGTVGYDGQNFANGNPTLKQILDSNNVDPKEVTIVSIDIDSDDAAVFENLGLDPLLVIVEYNNSFPSDTRIRNPRGRSWGNSSLEVWEVAKLRDMFLVAATNTNLIFAKNDLRNIFEELELMEALRPLQQNRLGIAYDGTLVRFTTGGMNTTVENFQGFGSTLIRQPIPRFMRGYPVRHGAFRWIYLVFIGFISNPVGFIRYSLGTIRSFKKGN
jgi:hypothetical protein